MKNKFLLLFISMLPFSGMAQEVSVQKTFWDDPINNPMTPFYALMGLVAIVIILIFVVAIMLLNVLNAFVESAAKKRASDLGIVYTPEPSWWTKLDRKLTNAVPLEKEATIVLEHDYDGIKELDNHLPPWWKWLFYGTIAWSIAYLVIYHITNDAPLQAEEYEYEVAIADEQIRKIRSSQPVASIDEATLAYDANADWIAKGAILYKSNCASCHKDKGEGGIGPNLTDEYWLHGGSIQNIFATIKNGVPEKGMISWSPILKPEEMRDVAFFIMSIKGSNPENPKAPQGVIWKDELTTPKPDTLKVKATL